MTTASRSEALPDLPTIAELVPGYEASAVGGIGAPKGTSVDIIEKLNAQINTALGDPIMKSKFADLGVTPVLGLPADFIKLIYDETDKWAKVIKFADIKVD